VLSEHDLLSVDPRNMDVERVKKDFDQFLQSYPAPTDEELHQLQELTEAIGNTWIKGNAEFAYNRVMEVSAKFQHYTKLLESIMEEKRRQSQEAKLLQGQRQRQQTDSTTTTTDGERDGMLLGAKTIPHSISDVILQSTHQQDFERKQSLLYDDTGVDHALFLLDGATKSVEKLTSPTAEDSGMPVHVPHVDGAGNLGGYSHQLWCNRVIVRCLSTVVYILMYSCDVVRLLYGVYRYCM
jgi:hypothetical protein